MGTLVHVTQANLSGSGIILMWILWIGLLMSHYFTTSYYLSLEDTPYHFVDVNVDVTPIDWR